MGEDAYLDVLSTLVEKYEDEHHSIPEATALEVLQFLMDNRKTNQRAVALGSGIAVSTMSEMFAGHRQINLDHMHKLAEHFQVPVSVFVRHSGKPSKRRSPVRRKSVKESLRSVGKVAKLR